MNVELPTSVTYMGCREVAMWKGEVTCLLWYIYCCTAGVIGEEFLCVDVLLRGGRNRTPNKLRVIIHITGMCAFYNGLK